MPAHSQLAWVTGAGGLIGSHLIHEVPAHARAWTVRAMTRETLDLTDYPAVARRFHEDPPDLIIHCAALSRTGACQENPALAHQLNTELTVRLSNLASEIPFFLLSSDLVFDGKRGYYTESDTPNPLNVYAETKLAAEQHVLRNPRHTVIRTSLNGGISPTRDRGFNEEMRRAWQAGRATRLFVDEFRCPLPARMTARSLWCLALAQRPGLYHLAGAERMSRFEIGQKVAARHAALNPRVEPISLRDYTGPPRSPDTSLNCAKIQALLPFPLPGFTTWLQAHVAEPF